MPPSSASARKPATRASDTRFEIVMVKRSLAAANAIRAGNSIRRARSRIMGLEPGRREAWGSEPESLAGNGERSENARDASPEAGDPKQQHAQRQHQREANELDGTICPAGRDRDGDRFTHT